MANQSIKNYHGFVDKRRGNSSSVNPSTALISAGNGKDITAMRARLTAISGTIYTSAVLNSMTENDMAYAILLKDDAASGVNG